MFAKDVAVIISKQSFLSTTSISTTLFTPTSTDIHRIIVFIESSTTFAGNPNVNLTYAANSGSATTRTCTQTEADAHTMQCVFNIRPLANNAVSISLTSPNSSDVYITVEEL